MNAKRVSAAAGVILAAQKSKVTAAGIAASLEAAGLLQSPESAAEVASPWERAVAGLNALVDADVIFHVEPDGHISAPFSDEHIEWDLKARRWVLTHDDEDEDLPPVMSTEDAALAAVDRSIDAQFPAIAADKWNDLHPVGTPVTAYPGRRPEDAPECVRLVTRTRTPASVLGDHTAVVWVDGHGACIKLTHVDPRPGGAS